LKRFSIGFVAALLALGAAWFLIKVGAERERASPSPARPPSANVASGDPAVLTAAELLAARHAVAESSRPNAAAPSSSTTDARLDVRVVARETGEPMAAIDVRLWTKAWGLDESLVPVSDDLPDPSRGLAGDSLSTSADGRVSFEVEAGIPYALEVCPWLRGRRLKQELEPLRSGEVCELQFEVETAYDLTLRGRVLDRATGGSIAGARIVLKEMESDYDESGVLVDTSTELDATSSAADGRFSLAAPSWLSGLGVLVDAPRYATGFVLPSVVLEDEGAEFEVELDRPASLEVRVVDDATPPRRRVRITIEAQPWDTPFRRASWAPLRFAATTDEVGLALIDALPPTIELSAEIEELSGEDRVHWFRDQVTLAPGEQCVYEVKLVRGARVHGTVSDQFGAPCKKTRLWLFPLPERLDGGFFYDRSHRTGSYESSVPAFTTTDEEGHFTFEDVPAGWTGIAPADLPVDSAVPLADRCAPAITSFMVEADADNEVDLRVERGLYISGRVVGPRGDARPGSGLQCLGSTPWSFFEAEADEAGCFRLGPLVRGEYGISAQPADDVFTTSSTKVVAQAGGSEIRVPLRAAGVLTGRVIDRSGEGREPEFTLTLRRPADPRLEPWRWRARWNYVDGDFELLQLVPGVYDMLVSNDCGAFAVARGVVVRENERTPCPGLILEQGGRVEMEYRTPAGASEVPSRHVQALFDGIEIFNDWGSRGLKPAFHAPLGTIEIVVVVSDDEGHERTHRESVDVAAAQVHRVVVPLDF
jgi:hypothetical protein